MANTTKYSLLLFFILIFAACSNNEPEDGNIQPDKNFPDPEETITVSLYKNTSQNIDGIYIDISDKLTSDNGWIFVSLGEMKGLGNISFIPLDGWENSISVKKGNGYIAYNPNRNPTEFYRLFISNSAADEMGTITGYQVKYQKPFYGIDQQITLEKSSFDVPNATETYIIHITNSSIIPYSIETDCDWIEIISQPIGLNINAVTDYGIMFRVRESNSLEQSTGTITLKTFFDKISTITITREAIKPWEPTVSILDLKNKHWKTNLLNNAEKITQPTIIRGKVVSSDEAGNLYKTLIIDDGTAAIALSLNHYNIYSVFPSGQEVAINLEGLYIGKYHYLMMVGEYSSTNSGDSSIGFTTFDKLNYQIIGEPTEISPINTTLSTLNHALFDESELIRWQSRYVTLSDIEFIEPYTPFVNNTEYSATNRLIYDASLLQMAVRTSYYCNFKSELTPKGVGSISGILSFYNGSWNLLMNSINDLGEFDPNKHIDRPDNNHEQTGGSTGDGTIDSPYNVAKVLDLNNPGTQNWVEGYIVGWIDSTNSYNSVFALPAQIASSFLIADKQNETDANFCIAVQLPIGNIRNELNLLDNPQNFNKKVQICGSLEKYFGKPGVKQPTAYNFID